MLSVFLSLFYRSFFCGVRCAKEEEKKETRNSVGEWISCYLISKMRKNEHFRYDRRKSDWEFEWWCGVFAIPREEFRDAFIYITWSLSIAEWVIKREMSAKMPTYLSTFSLRIRNAHWKRMSTRSILFFRHAMKHIILIVCIVFSIASGFSCKNKIVRSFLKFIGDTKKLSLLQPTKQNSYSRLM